MTVLRLAVSFWSFLALASNEAVASMDDAPVEFGRAAIPIGLKRSTEAKLFRSNVASFGVNRRKRQDVSEDDDLLRIGDLELSELERELRVVMSMSMSMSFGDPPGPPSAPAAGPSAPSSMTTPGAPSSSMNTPSAPSSSMNTPSAPSSSMNTPSAPTSMNTPSAPTTTNPPPSPVESPSLAPVFMTLSPTFETTTSATGAPSEDGTQTMSPTFEETSTATLSPSATLVPSPSPTTAVPPISPTTVFDLAPGTRSVEIVGPPHQDTTVVRLEIEYIVEGSVASTDEFEDEIDQLIFVTSVVASLGANDTGVLAQLLASTRRLETVPDDLPINRHRDLLASSYFLRDCNATSAGENCFIMGSDIVYILNGDRNADFDAYLAYLALHSQMSSFDDDIPNVTRVEYLSPSPILPPVSLEDQESAEDNVLSSSGSTTLSPVAIGAAAGASVLGLIALTVWRRNRHTRGRRHARLVEETSLQPPSSYESPQRHLVSHPL